MASPQAATTGLYGLVRRDSLVLAYDDQSAVPPIVIRKSTMEERSLEVGTFPVKLFDLDGIEIYRGPAAVHFVIGCDYFRVSPLEDAMAGRVYSFSGNSKPPCRNGVLEIDVEEGSHPKSLEMQLETGSK